MYSSSPPYIFSCIIIFSSPYIYLLFFLLFPVLTMSSSADMSASNARDVSVFYLVTAVQRACSHAGCDMQFSFYEKHIDHQTGFPTQHDAESVCPSAYLVVSYADYNSFNDASKRQRKTHLQQHSRERTSPSSSHYQPPKQKKRKRTSSFSSSSSSSSKSNSNSNPSASAAGSPPYILLPPELSTFPAPLVTTPAVEWDEAYNDIPTSMDKYKGDPAALYRDYGYCFIRGDESMKSLVATFNANVVSAERGHLARMNGDLFNQTVSEISGNVRQIEVTKLQRTKIVMEQFLQAVDDRIRHHLQSILPAADYERFVTSKYQLNTAKWLQAKPGKGEQALHLDSVYFERLSVLIYLGDTMSTLLPRYPITYGMGSNHQYEDLRSLRLWRRDLYHSIPVQAGDILFFRHDIIHAGVENKTSVNRNVLFLLYCDTSSVTGDKFQQYEWTWLFYHVNQSNVSDEFYSSLLRNTKYKPLRHFNTPEQQEAIRKTLLQHISTQLH
jgi:hypothetical protein